MKAKEYIPHTIEAEGITLPKELEELSELMAKNVHEVWAKTRIEQGWKYGETRNDEKKEHPCLVPYEELPEEERVYDRNTSKETLRFILKAGFNITPKGRVFKIRIKNPA